MLIFAGDPAPERMISQSPCWLARPFSKEKNAREKDVTINQ
jgi:hypothetical protein